MNRALFNRRIRQLHLWLGVAIGAQVGIWLVSGLFMTWFPIEQVRGEHLVSSQTIALDWPEAAMSPDAALAASGLPDVEQLTARRLGDRPVWQVENPRETVLVDALGGNVLSPLDEAAATMIGQGAYAGNGALKSASLLMDPPREYGRAGPVWRLDYAGGDDATLYVDAFTGEVRAVRTGLWRTFDFMWGLHIMDWSSRENFNSWWIKMTASLAVIFFLAGLVLVVLRLTDEARRIRRRGSE